MTAATVGVENLCHRAMNGTSLKIGAEARPVGHGPVVPSRAAVLTASSMSCLMRLVSES